MEAPFDADKSNTDLLNFSGSAGDMLAAMKAAGIVMPEAEEAARHVAAAGPGKPEAAAPCGDASCTLDHGHEGHDHKAAKKMAACSHDQSHEHTHGAECKHSHDGENKIKKHAYNMGDRIDDFALVCLTLALCGCALLRANDVVFFSAAACEALGSPFPAVIGSLAGVAGLLWFTVKRSSFAGLCISMALFIGVKALADERLAVPSISPLRPRVCLVTGANGGIGLGVAKELARQGHTVLLACRSAEKCGAARERLIGELSAPKRGGFGEEEESIWFEEDQIVSLPGLYLSSSNAMHRYATKVVAPAVAAAHAAIDSAHGSPPPTSAHAQGLLDVLVLNAGFIPSGNATSNAGWEAGLGDMHLGHFALVSALHGLGLVSPGTAAKATAATAAKAAGKGATKIATAAKSTDGARADPAPALALGRSAASLAGVGATGWSGTAVVVVSSDFSRVGGFHGSILAALKGTEPGEGDLRGEVTNGLSGVVPVGAPGVVHPHAGVPDGFTFGAYARAKLANVLYVRELNRRQIAGFAVAVHPGTVATDIVELPGAVGKAQALLSPLFLRSPAAAAAAVLTAAFGAQPWASDPFLRYANGQGVVLPPSALPFKTTKGSSDSGSTSSVDSLARALWAASQFALDKALS